MYRGGAPTNARLYKHDTTINWTELIRKYKEVIGFKNEDPDFVQVMNR
jgi:hypothetical protein